MPTSTATEACDEIKELILEALGLPCERCGMPGAEVIPCMTAYADPKANRSPTLCPECAEEYWQYWRSAWDDWLAACH